jgi:hypothetical protein
MVEYNMLMKMIGIKPGIMQTETVRRDWKRKESDHTA